MKARMAHTTRFLTSLSKPYWFAGIGVAVCSSGMHAQENFIRIVSAQVPSASAVPLPGLQNAASNSSSEKNASNSSEEVIRFKPSQSPIKDAGIDRASEFKDRESDDAKDKDAKDREAKDKEARDKEAKDKVNAKKREPIVLPALSVPNTAIQGVGTGSTPEDVVSGRLPGRISLPFGSDRYGFWALDRKTWVAPVFCHQPVYFEETMLERHGHERFPCIQPIVSGATFFTNIIFLPYQAYLQPPLQERYNTGNYRMGSAAPALRQRAPYDAGALRFQLLTTGTTILAGQP